MIEIRPITQRAARAWVTEHHRHLSAPRGDVLRVALYSGEELIGVATAGRPGARMLDDGRTLEITRVAVDGHRNACSRAYGALRRAGRELGYRRFLTYTLMDEPGSSLRGAGWVHGGFTDGGEWSRPSRERKEAQQAGVKSRWLWPRDAWSREIARWVRP